MRAHYLLGSIVAAAVAMWSCGGGGGGYSSSSPSTPSPTPTPAPAPAAPTSVTITIVGSDGSRAFTPNPVQVASGLTVVWRNSDSTTHNIVMDDGSAAASNIAPGTSSAPMPLRGSGGNYHCTIHPTMVGSINGATAPEPPPNPDPGAGY